MPSPDTLVVDVREEVDVFLARSEARGLAARSGFNTGEIEEIARLATTIATSVLRRGTVQLRSRAYRQRKRNPPRGCPSSQPMCFPWFASRAP